MRLFCGIILASCLSLPSAALPSSQQETAAQQEAPAQQETPARQETPAPKGTPPAESPATQEPPKDQQKPQAEQPAPGESKSEEKPETSTEKKTEPENTTKTEPPSTVSGPANDESSKQPLPGLKKKKDAGGSKAGAKRHASVKRASTSAPSRGPRRIVVREGGAAEPETQIVSGMTPEKASRERRNTETLLNSTREILEQLSERSLDAQRQETVSQIHNYMEGSRSALKEGDIGRAHTLAVKANLLADDLAKH